MAKLIAFCGPMPTDQPCPPSTIAADVTSMQADPDWYYAPAIPQKIVSRLQWLSHALAIYIKGTFKIRDSRNPALESFVWASQDIAIDQGLASGSIGSFGPATVEERLPGNSFASGGAFTQGVWSKLCGAVASGTISIPGSHEAFSDRTGYTATNYKVHWAIQLCKFAAVAGYPHFIAAPLTDAIHVVEAGFRSYNIPFFAKLSFECDLIYDTSDPANTPPSNIGQTARPSVDPLFATGDYAAGSVGLFDETDCALFGGATGIYDIATGVASGGLPAISCPLYNSNPFSTGIYTNFFETNIFIYPTALATIPSLP